ncbi:MAG: DNA translocase FtsK [bacterium]|nr:DNA translocase FtsK [bacterium]
MSRKKRRSDTPFEIEISPETKRGLLAVFFFASSLIILLSLLHAAGSAGAFLNDALTGLFGQARVVLVVILAALGALQVWPSERTIKAASVTGLILFLVTTLGFLEILGALQANSNWFGGYLGMLIAFPFLRGFGPWASLIIFIALFFASILIAANTSLETLFAPGAFLGRLFSGALHPLQSLFKKNIEPRILEGGEPIDVEDEADEDEEDEEEDDEEEMDSGFVSKKINPNQLTDTENIAASTADAEFSAGMKRRVVSRVDVPLDLLNSKTSKPTSGDIKKNMDIIENTLANFGIPVQMGDVSVGPTVTQFTFKPQDGIKLTKVTALANDLALALAAHPLRMEAPIPGKSLVGLEVPNQSVATVGLREVLDTQVFRDRAHPLFLALGKDVAGHPWFADLPRMPHLLVAGSTGSGKTVCLNAMIVSMLYQNSPDELKLILVDPKRVELPVYNGIPHLLVPTITDVPKTVNALKWTIGEMERRFVVLEQAGARDIGSYNKRSDVPMPAIVVVVDELADLMAAASREIEGSIIRIAQMARAVGIHLILATQRPSVDVITGLIKANIPARIAFAVASQTDSRTILDTSGAEKLLGRGDMLFVAPELSKPRRIQGAFVSEDETRRVVEFIKDAYEAPEYNPAIVEKQKISFGNEGGGGEDSDPLIPEAKDVILQAGKASASLLQRRLKVGYARAARLLDLLEAEGFIGPGDGAKPREILANDTGPTIFRSPEKEEAGENDVPPWE